jgi:hypothetical protein
VLLDGREIGNHSFALRGAGVQRELLSRAQFDVRLLGVPVYRYRHEALEQWSGGCLRELTSRTETNGAREQVRARTHGERLLVERNGASRQHAGCVRSFAYWDPQILSARQLLNSQTGELVPVSITPLGVETLTVLGQPRSVQRHRIDAPRLQIDLWYAGSQWVALEASDEGGRRLRYGRI